MQLNILTEFRSKDCSHIHRQDIACLQAVGTIAEYTMQAIAR
ncbi:hypothetical protein [Coleofasciculus sp. FACHB-1120]|nr:hypothetical protein [Coleofasciculus sp. FACHB-1120]